MAATLRGVDDDLPINYFRTTRARRATVDRSPATLGPERRGGFCGSALTVRAPTVRRNHPGRGRHTVCCTSPDLADHKMRRAPKPGAGDGN
jgi:hypothetical protein